MAAKTRAKGDTDTRRHLHREGMKQRDVHLRRHAGVDAEAIAAARGAAPGTAVTATGAPLQGAAATAAVPGPLRVMIRVTRVMTDVIGRAHVTGEAA